MPVAKAYAKAQRPFWKKKRAWALASIVGIVGIVVISNSGGGSEPTGSEAVDQAVAAQGHMRANAHFGKIVLTM